MIHIEDVSPVKSRTTISPGQSSSGKMKRLAVSADKGRVYAGNICGLWRSDDGGANWRQISWPQPAPGHGDQPGSLLVPNVYDIWISPSNPDIVLVGVGHDGRTIAHNGIYRSANGGGTWTLVHSFPAASRMATQIVSAPDDPNLIFAAGETSVAKSVNGGISFVDRFPWGNGGGAAWQVAIAPLDNGFRRVFALGQGRMWVSPDGGETWAPDTATPGAVGGPPDGRSSGDEPVEYAQTNASRVHTSVPGSPAKIYVAGAGRTLWSVDYTNFTSSGIGDWKALPVPVGSQGSGRYFLGAQTVLSGGHLLFYSDSNLVFAAAGPPASPAAWFRVDPNSQTHVDPHGLAVSLDFDATANAGTWTFHTGSLWMACDGGIYRSDDGGVSWRLGSCLATLGPIDVAVLSYKGATGLCMGTGDNSGFFSSDGGQHWKTQEYQGGDNDCNFSDPRQPSRLIVFAPRRGSTGTIALYANGSGGMADGAIGTSQLKNIPGPTLNGTARSWNAVSSAVLQGYRPLVLSLPSESPKPDGDLVIVRTRGDGSQVVLRTTKLSGITAPADWNTGATSDGPGVRCFQQGPVLPTGAITVVQSSGGQTSPTFYVGDPQQHRIWKWTSGMTNWQPMVPANGSGPKLALQWFVDPYRPARLYVLDATSATVQRSDDGGSSWSSDHALTQAISESGSYSIPLADSFYGGEAVLTDMQFDPEDGGRRFAVGYAGAFFTVDGTYWSRMMSTTALPAHPTRAALDTMTDACNHALYLTMGGRGLIRLRPLPVAMRVVDVTSITERTVVGPLTSWQTPNGPFNVEHLAGRDANGHLIVFWWSPQHDWQSIDVTAKTGHAINGPLTSWQTRNGPYNVEHLAARDANGHLLVFWWSPAHDWQVVDVTNKTGRTIANGVTSWQTPNGPFNVEHLAAHDASGNLLVFYWSPAHDWQAVDVTQRTHEHVATTPTSWQTPNGPYNVEHLAASTADGRLLVFYWAPAHDWQVIDVTAITGGRAASQATSWQTPNGPYNVEHLAATGPDGHLRVYYWAPTHNWRVIDVTAKTGVQTNGAIESWQTRTCKPVNFEHLAANDLSGHLRIFVWSPENDWYVTDVTALVNSQLSTAVTTWQTKNGPYNVEHLAAPDANGRLLVFYTRASEVLDGRSDGPKSCVA